MDEMEA